MTEPAPCIFTLRAEIGPCERDGCNGRHHPHPPGQFTCNPAQEHPYLGPKLGVCGHEEDKHEDVTLTLTVCKGCVPVGESFNHEHPGAHTFEPVDD